MVAVFYLVSTIGIIILHRIVTRPSVIVAGSHSVPTSYRITATGVTAASIRTPAVFGFYFVLIIFLGVLHRVIGRSRFQRMIQLIGLFDVSQSHIVGIAGVLTIKTFEFFTHCLLKVLVMVSHYFHSSPSSHSRRSTFRA